MNQHRIRRINLDDLAGLTAPGQVSLEELNAFARTMGFQSDFQAEKTNGLGTNSHRYCVVLPYKEINPTMIDKIRQQADDKIKQRVGISIRYCKTGLELVLTPY